jgi:DNA-binding response OmpR family regulator
MSKRVLVVDDDPVFLEMFDRSLSHAGHTVVPFTRFEDARTFLAHNEPDVLVADVRLGAFNGIHLAVQARQCYTDVAIVVLSGYDDVVLREETARCGATFILKPLSSVEMVAAVDRAMPRAIAH